VEHDLRAGARARRRSRPPAAVRLLPLALVDANPQRRRRSSRGVALQELVRSIARDGLREPVQVRRAGARYVVVSGERRCAAARLAGLTEIPAVVLGGRDCAAVVEVLVERVHTEELSLAERAEAIHAVRAALGGPSWATVARRLGMSRGHLHRLLAFAQLPESMRGDVRLAGLTEKHVRALRQLDGCGAAQRELWDRIHGEGMSGERALRAAAAALGAARSAGQAGGGPARFAVLPGRQPGPGGSRLAGDEIWDAWRRLPFFEDCAAALGAELAPQLVVLWAIWRFSPSAPGETLLSELVGEDMMPRLRDALVEDMVLVAFALGAGWGAAVDRARAAPPHHRVIG
jgi:ParB family chromosome partitioning protein